MHPLIVPNKKVFKRHITLAVLSFLESYLISIYQIKINKVNLSSFNKKKQTKYLIEKKFKFFIAPR